MTDSRRTESGGVEIPLGLRIGGAFLSLAAVLLLMGFVSMLRDGFGASFDWTWRNVALVVAALLVGGFATQRRDQKASRAQVMALGIAVVLIAGSMLLPQVVLHTMGQYMLFLYAGAALICALIIRRTAHGRG